MLVSIIVPAYKKEKTIKRDIKSIVDAMNDTRFDYEVIVVVDGELDKTTQVAKRYVSRTKSLKDVVHIHGYKTNHGKGYAVRYGMARAKGDIVTFIDAGSEINASGISMIIEHMLWYDADIIVGSKRHPASKVNFPHLRKIYSWGYHKLVRLLFGLKVRDTQAGLKAYKRKVLEKTLPRLIVKQYAFDIELLAVAHRLGFTKIYEAPVEINWDFRTTRFKGFLFFDPFIRLMLTDTLAVYYRMYILNYYDDGNKRKWKYDKELQMRVNLFGEEAREK